MSSIGKITIDTLPELREMGEKFAASVGYPGGFCYDAFAEAWTVALTYNLGEIFCARDGDGKIVGLLGCHFAKDPFNGWKVAAEQFWFVLPEARRSSAAIRLLNRFEKEAEIRESKKILMLHLDGEFGESLASLYERRGYKLVEKTFAKEL